MYNDKQSFKSIIVLILIIGEAFFLNKSLFYEFFLGSYSPKKFFLIIGLSISLNAVNLIDSLWKVFEWGKSKRIL
jgi:UDP-N-acetylmuramyl pentapeptide phosphotransferase/UDP-N-acetylglucosamine-1-phosphate transferase